MITKGKWAAIPGLVALAACAIVLSAYSGASSPQGREPVQPINFPHPRHVQTLGMNCLYCHFAANKSPDPGMPAVGTCMGCHQVVLANTSPEIKKLATYYYKEQPVPWVRIHKVPEYVRFPHMRHVNAGVTCQDCHGQVQEMSRVYQANSLNMGWCLNCHIGNYKPAFKARYDCSTCHY
jgi:c(7)-type cytochrome triheme protein